MTCMSPVRLAALVDEELSQNDARRATEHIRVCARCNEQYQQLVRLTEGLQTLPTPPVDTEMVADVMSRLDPSTPNPWRLGLPAFCAMAAAAVIVVLSLPEWSIQPQGDFAVRGASTDHASRLGFAARRHTVGKTEPGSAIRSGDRVPLGTGFSFEVYNRTDEKLYLLLFAQDAALQVHWFYPAFQNASQNPRAMLLMPGAARLPEAVAPEDVEPGAFRLAAVFLSQPVSVRRVEALLANGDVKRLGEQLPAVAVQTLDMVMRPQGAADVQ